MTAQVASSYAIEHFGALPATRLRNGSAGIHDTPGPPVEELLLLKQTIATAVALLLSAVSAEAQYFGRNKVQYDRFQFAILETEHFDVYYYAEERSAAEVAGWDRNRLHLRSVHLVCGRPRIRKIHARDDRMAVRRRDAACQFGNGQECGPSVVRAR